LILTVELLLNAAVIWECKSSSSIALSSRLMHWKNDRGMNLTTTPHGSEMKPKARQIRF